MSDLPGSEHLGIAKNEAGQFDQAEALRAAYASKELMDAAIEPGTTLEQRDELRQAADKVADSAAANFDTARNEQAHQLFAAREKLRILGEPAQQERPPEATEALAPQMTPEEVEQNLNEIFSRLTTGEDAIKMGHGVHLSQDTLGKIMSQEDAIAERFKNVPPSPERDEEIDEELDKIWDLVIESMVDWERRTGRKFDDVAAESQREAEPAVAEAQATAEATVEQEARVEYSAEQIGQMAQSTIDMYCNVDMSTDAKRTYLQSARENGHPVTGPAIEGSSGGWQTISQRSSAETKFNVEGVSEPNRSGSYEDLSFYPAPSGDESKVEVCYMVMVKGGDSLWKGDEIGLVYNDGTGRPGRQLRVAFELPREAARQLAAMTESNPTGIREAVERAVLDSGMPREVWDKSRTNSLKPFYMEPLDGYRIGVRGGQLVGAEDYTQQLRAVSR